MSAEETPLWTCPRCGHQFVSRNLSHSCGRYEIDDHFTGKDVQLRQAFDRLVEIAEKCGPVTFYAQKTRLVLMVRVRFANIVVRKHSLDLGLWLTRRIEHPRLHRTDVFGPATFVHLFRLSGPVDIDPELEELICEAYKTGRQEHLRAGRRARG
jgi:hypothetical protein